MDNNQYGTCAKRRNQNNKIPIKQYDKSNNFIKTWESAIDIQNQIGINQGSIIACCRNKLKTAGGYIWRYKENNITQKTKKQLMQEINQLIIQLAQEKEKNKELEIKNEWLNNQYDEMFDDLNKLDKNSISRDKIKEIKKMKESYGRPDPFKNDSDYDVAVALGKVLELVEVN